MSAVSADSSSCVIRRRIRLVFAKEWGSKYQDTELNSFRPSGVQAQARCQRRGTVI